MIVLAHANDSLRLFLTGMLERAGYRVFPCKDGAKAFSKLKKRNTALLLTDVGGKIDGVGLAKKAAELTPDLKIIFITGFAAVPLTHVGDSENVRVLSPPVHLKEIVGAVTKTLGRAR